MIVLWLVEFALVALILVMLFVLIQRLLAHARRQRATGLMAHEWMRLDEARKVVLLHAQREIERGATFEQAVLNVLSDHYWPDDEDESHAPATVPPRGAGHS